MTLVRTKIVAVTLLGIGIVLGAVALAAADDETNDVEVKVQAPIQAVACDPSAPQTLTVLGLTIDISTANVGGDGESGGDSGDGSVSGGSGSGSDDDGSGDDTGGSGSTGGCASLTVGQTVEVKLTSDTTLTATEVGGGDSSEAAIQGSIQSVDPVGKTITVLGLTIDVSAANAQGADDDSSDGSSQAIDLTQLMPGQIAEIKLDASQLPALVATELQVKNFANQVEVEVDDDSGQEVDDMDNSGNPMDDVDVQATETIKVQNPVAGGPRRIKKVVQLHRSTNGSFVLSGLPTGRVKINVTRVHNGVTAVAHRGVGVQPNTRRALRVRLHHAH